MKIFITGATGYIGAKLALTLAKKGHQVYALVRNSSKTGIIDHKNIQCFPGDLSDKKSIGKAMMDCEGVFHLAAYARVWSKNPEKYFIENVQGTVNILESALKNSIKKFVYTSTTGVIGPSEENSADENNTRKIDFFNEYESSKAMAETKVREFSGQGLHAVIVSPPRVYGPGLLSQSNAVTILIKKYINGQWRIMPGNGTGMGSYAYIDDVVNGHIQAMELGKAGEKYILGGVNASYKELFNTIRKISQTNYKLFRLPFFIVQSFAHFQHLMAITIDKEPSITPKWTRKYLYDWSLSSEKAKAEIGYHITPLEEGLKKTIDWLRSTKEI